MDDVRVGNDMIVLRCWNGDGTEVVNVSWLYQRYTNNALFFNDPDSPTDLQTRRVGTNTWINQNCGF